MTTKTVLFASNSGDTVNPVIDNIVVNETSVLTGAVSGTGFVSAVNALIAGGGTYDPTAVAITGGTINGTTVGATTPASGKFTTVQPSSTGGIIGTTAADNANAGSVGEVITATGTAVSMINGTLTNVVTISLTAGDWDVHGAIVFVPGVATTMSSTAVGISETTITMPAAPFASGFSLSYTLAQNCGYPAATQRINVSTTTPVYLVGYVTFDSGTCTSTGTLTARRRR